MSGPRDFVVIYLLIGTTGGKGYIEGKFEEVPGGLYFPAVDIDGVAHRLECIERDPDRQQDIQIGQLH